MERLEFVCRNGKWKVKGKRTPRKLKKKLKKYKCLISPKMLLLVVAGISPIWNIIKKMPTG